MALLRTVVVWSLSYSISITILLSLLGTDSSILVAISVAVAANTAFFLVWACSPALIDGRAGMTRVVSRLKRTLWIVFGSLILGFIPFLWVVVVAGAVQDPSVHAWQLLVLHAVGGLALLALFKIAPPDDNILTLSGREPLKHYDELRDQLKGALDNKHYERFLELLMDRGLQDTATFLFTAEGDNARISRQIVQFIEEARFVRKSFSPLRAKERQDWAQWIKEQGSYWKIGEAFPSRRLSYSLKRFFEFFLALTAFFGPLLPLIWLLIVVLALQFRSIRRVFFIGSRVGLGGSLFRHYQFRTFKKIEGDRTIVTRLGSLLIWTGLDQLPALWEVIIGKMSLVGPYPMYPSYLMWKAKEERATSLLKIRMSVRPGILDPALADALSRPILYSCVEECLVIDFKYTNSWSLSNDISIFLRSLLLYVTFMMPNGFYSFVHSLPFPKLQEMPLPVPKFLRGDVLQAPP